MKICDVLALPYSKDTAFSLNQQEEKTWGDFLTDCASLAFHLEQSPIKKWALYCDDSYQFAVGFFALLQAQKELLLPPNSQDGTLAELKNDIQGTISDNAYGELAHFTPIQEQKHDYAFTTLEEDVKITLLTSGSTGERKAVHKTLEQLQREITILEKTWGSAIKDDAILATVSHQHIYGLLFRLLWPIAAGRPFYSQNFLQPEVILEESQQSKGITLISCPAHLRHMPEMIDLQRLSKKVSCCFSSGGPLALETALAFEKDFGQAPIEVFGSTETGGVAWRQQSQNNQTWTCLETISFQVGEDSRLLLQSPFLYEDFLMDDCIEALNENQFLLKGRHDRIVKIAEKRLSLVEMEMRLKQFDLIKDASIIILEENSRRFPAATLVLNEQGSRILQEEGRMKMRQELRKELLQYFEAIVLPKKWRYAEQIPEDSQGKRNHQELKKLFDHE